jgi:hypothetical protein
VLALLCPSPVTFGQATKAPLAREQALTEVRRKSIGAGEEVISAEGRFRVVFPHGSVIPDDDVSSLHGFKVIDEKVTWSAIYSDLGYSLNSDEELRANYHRAVEAITRNALTKCERDTVLNGTLGDEVVILKPGFKTFSRDFLVGSRFYSVSVGIKENPDQSCQLPAEVREFFDSFTFWLP